MTMSNRMMRLSEFMRSPEVKCTVGQKCLVHNCRAKQLRKTEHGIYCMKHYVDGVECKTPDCHYPAIEIGLCCECLNADDPEEMRFTPPRMSSLADGATAGGFSASYKMPVK